MAAREFAPYSPVQLSKDGRWLACTVLRGGPDRNSRPETSSTEGFPWYGLNAEVYVLDTQNGAARDLTPGLDNNFLPRWAPDGRALAFVSNRGNSDGARLWLWESEAERFRRLSDRAVDADQLSWTPSGRALLVTISDKVSAALAATPLTGDGVKVYRSRHSSLSQEVGPTSEAWSLDEKLRDLVEIDSATGVTRTLVHSDRIAHFLLSPDGSSVAYTAPRRFERAGSQQILNDIIVVDHFLRTAADDRF